MAEISPSMPEAAIPGDGKALSDDVASAWKGGLKAPPVGGATSRYKGSRRNDAEQGDNPSFDSALDC
jgi:hypothetical protein